MSDFDGVDWSRYFGEDIARDTDLPELPLRDKPCEDCAVTCGLYTPFTEGLAAQPEDVQRAVSAKWFCHATPERACRGNVNLLTTLNRRMAR